MSGLPVEFLWFVIIGTVLIVLILFAFIGITIINNRSLKEERDFSFSILQNSTGLILVLDENGIIKKFNTALELITGFKASEVIGKSVRETGLFRHNSTLSTILYGLSDKIRNIDTELITFSGDEKTISWSCNQFEGIAEKKSWIIWTGIDITELKMVQSELKNVNLNLEDLVAEQTEELQSLIDQSGFAVMIFDTGGHLISHNIEFKNFLEPTPDIDDKIQSYNILEKPLLSYPKFSETMKLLFNERNSFNINDINTNEDVNYFNFKENTRWLSIHLYSVEHNDGIVFRIVLLLKDITEQKEKESMINAYQENQLKSSVMLETLENERKRISRDLHDDIGQLLTGTKLKLETYEYLSGAEHEVINDAKELLLKANTELKNIIKDLHPQELDKFGLIASLENLISRLFSNSGIIVNFENNFHGKVLKAYEIPIFRIVQEALGNIIKHSQATKCNITFTGSDNILKIVIEDNGIGFDQSENISAIKYRISGNGLINMSQRANFLNCKMDINSELNKGTIISITIPMVDR